MGYYMAQRSAQFHLPHRHFKAALQAVRELPAHLRGHLTTEQTRSLPKILAALDWAVEQEAQTGDMVGIRFTGEKSHQDTALFKALAPFVKRGSFIAMGGEDGCLWR